MIGFWYTDVISGILREFIVDFVEVLDRIEVRVESTVELFSQSNYCDVGFRSVYGFEVLSI